MTTTTLPISLHAPASGWVFQGDWLATDQATIEQTLRVRIPNPLRAQHDPWLFLRHAARYYAHSPTIHRAGTGFVAATPAELAEHLWDHYFSLHLGPLAWSPPTEAAPSATPQILPQEGIQAPVEPLVVNLEHEWRALDHFQAARALLADADYAAAKRELDLSLALDPPTSFFDHKRLETLGDIESCLGNDAAALRHYQRALDLVLGWQESWSHTELRLKLAWLLLRQSQLEQARDLVETALALCQEGTLETAGNRRGLAYVTALAFATRADVHFHQHDSDAAIASARQAAAMASRLGQGYAEKVRLLAYLAWQLYLHGETTEARVFARRAQSALERWMPLDAHHVRALRTTLATILGPSAARHEPAPRATIPSHTACVQEALVAARSMQDWLRQLLALHALAPYLAPGQLRAPLTDIRVWGDDYSDEQPYQRVLAADLAHALGDAASTVAVAAQRLTEIAPQAFRYLQHEWLYAESLLRIRGCVVGEARVRIENAIRRCVVAWCDTTREHQAGDVRASVLSGLAVLLPHLPPDVSDLACVAVEDALLAQLQPQSGLYPSAFLTCLPALARCGAGQRVVEVIEQRERQSLRLWIACLAHTDADDEAREAIVETALGGLETWLRYGSTTEVAEVLCSLAPYLEGEQARRALALATSVRSITPRVRALAAIAGVLPAEEGRVVYETAWKAAQRSSNADVRGEALTAVVVSMGTPKDG